MIPVLTINPEFPLGLVSDYSHVDVSPQDSPVFLRNANHERGGRILSMEFHNLDTADLQTIKTLVDATRSSGRFSWTPPDSSSAKNYRIIDPNIVINRSGPFARTTLTIREDL